MKLITFNKAFEIENIIAIILRFFHHNISKLDQAKWDLNSLTWLNLKENIYIYIYIYIFFFIYMNMDLVFLDPWKDESIQSCESSDQVDLQFDHFLITHELFILSPFLFFSLTCVYWILIYIGVENIDNITHQLGVQFSSKLRCNSS